MGTLKERVLWNRPLGEKQSPSVTGYNLTGEGTGRINAPTLLSSSSSFRLPFPGWLPISEPNPEPADGTAWVILPGQSRVASGFEALTGRDSPSVTFDVAAHSVIQAGVSARPCWGPVPVLKLPADREDGSRAVLASAVEGGILPG